MTLSRRAHAHNHRHNCTNIILSRRAKNLAEIIVSHR